MRDTLLIIHIVAVSLWLGGSVMNGLLNVRLASTGNLSAQAVLARVEENLGTTFYAPVAILTLLTGIGLVLGDEAYSFGDVFVSAGFLAIIVAAVLGPTKFTPLGERMAEAFEAGDAEAGQAASREISRWSALDVGLILIALALMVIKPGL